MSAATSLALEKPPRRGFPRYPIQVPLDVIALRSGVPVNLPGRCVDLGEGGVGAIVAGVLCAGQQVAIELRLPNVGLPVRARAIVLYQGGMRYGFGFVGLPAEQREMIRYWANRLTSEPAHLQLAAARKDDPSAKTEALAASPTASGIHVQRRRFRFLLCATVAIFLLAAGWWHWQRSWNDLEDGTTQHRKPLRVSPETMTARIISKIDPVYPEEARRTGRQGLAVLDAVIAADGTVKRLQAVAGDDLLVQSAADAVRQWRFEPYRSATRALEVETTIAVEFRLN